jgi:ABC-type branched-subunit amino acid transport system permease subunit
MKTFRIVVLIAALTLIVIHLLSLDFQDLRFTTNRASYIGIMAMTLVALNFLLGIIKDRNSKKD